MKYKIEKTFESETKKYMSDVIKKLEKDGKIQDDWSAALTMLSNNYNNYIKATKLINAEGLQIKNRFGDYIAHPLIKVAENANIQCLKLLLQFGLTKYSATKIGEIPEAEEDSPLLNFAKSKKIEKR
jgi:P27 family predicted phage terminase small subunit